MKEYKIINRDFCYKGDLKFEFGHTDVCKNLEKELNTLAKQGWEVKTSNIDIKISGGILDTNSFSTVFIILERDFEPKKKK